jgi:hypothetical protein
MPHEALGVPSPNSLHDKIQGYVDAKMNNAECDSYVTKYEVELRVICNSKEK